MSNVYTLDTLRDEIEQKYSAVQISVGRTKVNLRPLLRLNADERKTVIDAVASVQASDTTTGEGFEAMAEGLLTIIGTVAAKDGEVLVNSVRDDVALAMKIVELWSGATQAGEAQNSPG